MILPLLVLAAAQTAPPPREEQAYRQCVETVRGAPDKAVQTASDWLVKGGGLFARQCLGLAYVQLERWAPAAAAFEQAALEAERDRDARAADFWVQSGNAWLAGGDSARALKAFDAALATTALTPELRGEVHLDRGRAAVMAGDEAGARRDLDKGLELVPADPFAWYLSAALAQRQNDLKRAQADIARAMQMAPGDADILLLAGNIAGLSNEAEAARTFYARAAEAAPGSPAAAAARAALAANPAPAPPEARKPATP